MLSKNMTQGGGDTFVRVAKTTKRALDMTQAEMTLSSGEPIKSVDETIVRLVDHWMKTKEQPVDRPSPLEAETSQ